jgi:hypothetical protein
MVPGDHHDPHPSALCLADRHTRLGPRRVDDADHPQVHQLAFELLQRFERLVGRPRRRRGLDVGERPVGDCERAERQVGQPLDVGGDLRSADVGQPLDLAGDPLVGATGQQHVGGALRHDVDAALPLDVGLEGAHELALRCEGHLGHPLETGLAGLGDAQLGLGHQEGGLGGIALHGPFPAVLAQHRVVGEAPAGQHEPDLVGHGGVAIAQRASVDHDVALRSVARPRHLGHAGPGDHRGHRHLVAGQGAGLVRADDRCRSQRLDRGQLLDDGALAGHALDPQRQHDRQDGRQALGHRRDRQRHPDEQHVDQVGGAVHVGGHQDGGDHHDGDDHHGDGQRAPDALDLALQRRALLLGAAEQAGDVAHLGVHAGRGDHRAAAPTGHGGAAEHHVDAVPQRDRAGERGRVLENRFALPRQRRLRHRERRRLHQAGVGRQRVPL